MPSIMPLGATISAPARAWTRACWPSMVNVASLSTSTRPPVSPSAAAVAVARIFTETDIGNYEQFGGRLLDDLNRLRDDAQVAGRIAPHGIFFGRDPEQQNSPEPQSGGQADLFGQQVRGHLEMPGHGGDLLPAAASRADEQRQKQVRGRQTGLADKAANGRVIPKPPHPRGERTVATAGMFIVHGRIVSYRGERRWRFYFLFPHLLFRTVVNWTLG